jgi:cytochrome c553
MSKSINNRNCTAEGSHVLLSLIGFGLALILSFTLVANMMPQVEGEAPVDEEINLDEMTMKTFVALGESIFTGKGTCTLCHNALGRAPDILKLNMTVTANERFQDSRYQGKAKNVEGYLRESMLEPSIFVVKGYGQKGSNDTVSPMPASNKAPALLTAVEMDALIAFMQAKDGYEITVALPAAEEIATPEPELAAEATVAPATLAAKSVDEAIAKHLCTACHSMGASESSIGPNLNTVGSRLTADEIRQSIIEPNAVTPEGFTPGVMPQDYAQKMTVSELNMIVEDLLDNKNE